MEKKELIAKVVEKLKKQDLYESLIIEKDPVKIESTFRNFLDENELKERLDVQGVFAFLKSEGLFKEHVKTKEQHDVWLKLRNEYVPGFLLEN